MPNPQQPEPARSRRSAATPEQQPAATRRRARAAATTGAPPDTVPEDNRPGHHPEVEQDKPDRDRLPPGSERHFRFAFEPAQLVAGLPFGVTPLTTGVTVRSDTLHIRYGPWSLETSLANVAGTETTGPYQLVKIAGPPHISLADRGISFATRRSQGMCIRFREPVPAALPFGLIRHPAATVTVEDGPELERLLGGGS